jgi:hypothetical protein
LVCYDGLGNAPPHFQNIGNCSQIAIFKRKFNNQIDNNNNVDQFQLYLQKKKRINYSNYRLKMSEEKSIQMSTHAALNKNLEELNYFDKDCLTQQQANDDSYKLIASIKYPFQIVDYDTEAERNEAIIHEIKYLIRFTLTQRVSDAILYEKLVNDIDPFDDDIKLIDVNTLASFSSLKKFKVKSFI